VNLAVAGGNPITAWQPRSAEQRLGTAGSLRPAADAASVGTTCWSFWMGQSGDEGQPAESASAKVASR
jgi:hypothetical protein